MGSGEKKRKSFLGVLLKIILVILIVVFCIAVGGYLFLRFGLGIDIIDIKKKINLLNANVNESEIVTLPYTNNDAFEGFNIMFGENEIYVFDGENYTFNEEEFNNASISGGVELTSNQFISCTNIFMKNFVSSGVDVSGVAINAELKQLEFANFRVEEENIKVDTTTIFKFDFTSFKDEIRKANNFIGNLISKYIPNSIYLSINAEVCVNSASDNSYTITPKSIKINNLSLTQSQEILDIFSKLYSEEKDLMQEITTQFVDTIFSTNNGGLLSTLNVNNFTFKLGENNNIYIVLN